MSTADWRQEIDTTVRVQGHRNVVKLLAVVETNLVDQGSETTATWLLFPWVSGSVRDWVGVSGRGVAAQTELRRRLTRRSPTCRLDSKKKRVPVCPLTPTHIPWISLVKLAKGLFSGLAWIHARGVVHGDIQAANVGLCPDGEPCLWDFGSTAPVVQGCERVSAVVSKLQCRMYQRPGSENANIWWAETISTDLTDVWAAALLLLEVVLGMSLLELQQKVCSRRLGPRGTLADVHANVVTWDVASELLECRLGHARPRQKAILTGTRSQWRRSQAVDDGVYMRDFFLAQLQASAATGISDDDRFSCKTRVFLFVNFVALALGGGEYGQGLTAQTLLQHPLFL